MPISHHPDQHRARTPDKHHCSAKFPSKWSAPHVKGHYDSDFSYSIPINFSKFQSTKVGVKPVNGVVSEEARRKLVPTREKKFGIVLHHTYEDTLDATIGKLNEKRCSYHFVIDKKGTIYGLHDPNMYLSHAFNHNTGTIGVACIGGKPGDKFTPAQLASVKLLCRELEKQISTLKRIGGHHGTEPRNVNVAQIANELHLKLGKY